MFHGATEEQLTYYNSKLVTEWYQYLCFNFNFGPYVLKDNSVAVYSGVDFRALHMLY